MELLWIGGALVVALAMFQMVWGLVDLMRRSSGAAAARQRQAELLEQRVLAARQVRTRQQAERFTWAGWRKFEVVRKVVEDQNKETASFYLAAHDGKAIAPFEPGQYLTFQIKVPGEAQAKVRCYSLSDCTRSDHYRVTIKRAVPPKDKPDAPPGVVSNHFLDQIDEGWILDAQAPRGDFYMRTDAEFPVVLIGGGVGVTPMVAMINHIAESQPSRQAWFFYCVRNHREHILRDHLIALDREHPNIHVHIAYSRPGDEDREGEDYHHAGRVDMELLKRVLPSNNFDFFMCGPGAMMDDLTEGLRDWGVPGDRIHTEQFGPSKSKKSKKDLAPPPPDAPQITFKRSDKTLTWNPQAEHIYELAMDNDIRLESGCLTGSCGACQVAIIEGDVEYDDEPSFECEAGSCLTCCCKPKGPVVLDA